MVSDPRAGIEPASVLEIMTVTLQNQNCSAN